MACPLFASVDTTRGYGGDGKSPPNCDGFEQVRGHKTTGAVIADGIVPIAQPISVAWIPNRATMELL